MKIRSILRCSSFTRTWFPLLAVVFTAGCANSPVTEPAEGKELTVEIPVKTAMVFSRADAIASARQYAESSRLHADQGAQVTGIIERNFSQLPETHRLELSATADNRQRFCATLESLLNKLLVPGRLYTHENKWTHASIPAKTRGESTMTMCQGDGPFPANAILTTRFVKEWDWGRYSNCPACYADSFVELTVPIRLEIVRADPSGDERLRLSFRLASLTNKVPKTPLGNAVAETHFDREGFFSALSRLPEAYPRHEFEPEDPYAKAVAQTKQDIAALANQWRQKVANDRKAAKEATFAQWRTKIKVGDEGWVGPVSFGQYSGDLMMHALVVERRGELLRIQYDGRTDQNTAVSLREKEAWVKVRAFYPESEFTAGRASWVFEPNAMPMVR